MIRLEAATLTDPGRERQVNQDRVWAQIYAPSEGEPVGLFMVCDGIGHSERGVGIGKAQILDSELHLPRICDVQDCR